MSAAVHPIAANVIRARPLLWVAMLTAFLASFSLNSWAGEICSELSRYFPVKEKARLLNPTRQPTKAEALLIDTSKIDLLEHGDHGSGADVVDVDNDGKAEVFVWSIQGSGRFVYAGIYELPRGKGPLVPKGGVQLGFLEPPEFVRFKGLNLLVSSGSGDQEGIEISRIYSSGWGANRSYTLERLCTMQVVLKAETKCRHPACKELVARIGNDKGDGQFTRVERPHMGYPPAGLSVYFDESSTGDFDNSGEFTAVWRIGRSDYQNANIYWALLGLGEDMPEVDPALAPQSEDKQERRVLEGVQHDRLRRALSQQTEVLSAQLHKPVSLPKQGEFFLFSANQGRTYWAWDLGEPPYGAEIHITYTNPKKSDYIGSVNIKRNLMLVPCVSECGAKFEE